MTQARKMPTLSKRIETWLAAIGMREVKSSSRKYKCFEHEGLRYWLGKAGALRAGPTATGSYNIANRIPSYIMAGVDCDAWRNCQAQAIKQRIVNYERA
jgi:hypothetical protein